MVLFSQVEPIEGLVDEQARLREGVRNLTVGVLEQLPSIITALVVVAFFALVAWGARLVTRRVLLWRTGRPSFAEVISRLVRASVIVLGILIGLVIAAPSVDVAQLVGGLGVSSIAIGFAFAYGTLQLVYGALTLQEGRFYFTDTTRERCEGEDSRQESWIAQGTVEALGETLRFHPDSGTAFSAAEGLFRGAEIRLLRLHTEGGTEEVDWLLVRRDRPGR